jgi:hypothetical protein
MSAFTGLLVIAEIEPGRRWRLASELQYEAGVLGSGRWITVPEGFETDGATIPRLLRVVLAVWGTYGRAACIHDLGYRMLCEGKPHVEMPTRKACDYEFLIAMRACGTRASLALLMWAAVRTFGWLALKKTASP